MSERKVVTVYVHPPIPARSSDWQATFDDFDPERNDPIGWGATEAEAIANLHDNAEPWSMGDRFFFDRDQDSRWFLIPEAKRAEWVEWCTLPSDDERAWNDPDWAQPLNSGPQYFSFTDPQEIAR